MKKLLLLLLLAPAMACATTTANKVPVTKTGGSAPALQDSDITDIVGTSVNIGVPTTIQSKNICLSDGTNCSSTGTGSGTVSPSTSGIVPVYTGTTTVGGGNITDNGATVAVSIPLIIQGNPVCTTGSVCSGYQGSLGLNKGTYVNGGLCTYNSSGSLINCSASSSGIGSVLSVGTSSPNSTIQSVGGTNPVTSTGTINLDINWTTLNSLAQINTGGLNWYSINSIANINQSGVNWTNLSKIINSVAINWSDVARLSPINYTGVNWLTVPNYTTGDVLQATTNGGVNWNTAGAGSGTVTAVTASSPLLSSGGTSPGISVNWTAFNLLGDVNMGGINWFDAKNLNQGVNWYQVDLTTKSTQTTGAGVGYSQFWNAARIFFFNQSVNSAIGASYGINWPAIAPTTNQVLQAVDNIGTLNWENASLLNNSVFNTTTGLTINGSTAGPFGVVANNTNASGLAVNDVQDTSTSLYGGEIQTGPSYALPNVFGVGSLTNEPTYIVANGSPVADYNTSGSYFLSNASSSAVGKATCWTTSGQIGYCTTIVGSSGGCTCTGL